jgi:vacuolar-type H+-ATPase subunit C/Vma6
MKPLKYNEIMPRVAIEKLKLIETDDLLDLLGKNLEAIRCALLETSYREDISRIPKEEADSISMEEALLENYSKTLRNLVKFSVGDVKNVLSAVVGKLETSNVKTLLRATKARMNVNEAVKHIVPVGKLSKDRCKDILSTSSTVEDVIGALSDSEYGAIMGEVLVENKETDDLFALELALDMASYTKIFEAIEKLKGVDKTIARNVLGIEVDAINVKSILRDKERGTPKDQTKMHFMPPFLLDEGTLEKALESKDVKSIAEYLLGVAEAVKNPFYKSIFSQILRECNSPLSKLEVILDKAALAISLDMLKKYFKYYNIGYIMAFLNLKWFEIRNLRCIIVGSERKTAPFQIKRFLILNRP